MTYSNSSSGSERSGGYQSGGRGGESSGAADGQRPQAKRQFFRRRKTCPFSGASAMKIDYKDVRVLSKFVSERGKIMPSRISAVSMKKQRELSVAIKRSRFLALMPYVNG
ncbi:MAG: 30S ribosomal protein S18 [Alphaproteobacteria bacterium]|nr:30S ribosomal protein S18 [Alphaproteobacteria bacterium]